MKSILLFILLLICETVFAQDRQQSREDFINAICSIVVDSGFTHYYLSETAYPSSFKKFDYDDWYKYGLKQDIPFEVLTELSKQIWEDSSRYIWQQSNLHRAICVGMNQQKEILSAQEINKSRHLKNKNAFRTFVFFFSKPAFTMDHQYAVIDMGFRCDNHQCGMGATFLFKQENNRWILAGKKQIWGN